MERRKQHKLHNNNEQHTLKGERLIKAFPFSFSSYVLGFCWPFNDNKKYYVILKSVRPERSRWRVELKESNTNKKEI